MAFDVVGAKAAGYSEQEIEEYLGSKSNKGLIQNPLLRNVLGGIANVAPVAGSIGGQIVGTGVGAIGGTVAGAPTGPGAIATGIGGGIVGRSVGSGIGQGAGMGVNRFIKGALLGEDVGGVQNIVGDIARSTGEGSLYGLLPGGKVTGNLGKQIIGKTVGRFIPGALISGGVQTINNIGKPQEEQGNVVNTALLGGALNTLIPGTAELGAKMVKEPFKYLTSKVPAEIQKKLDLRESEATNLLKAAKRYLVGEKNISDPTRKQIVEPLVYPGNPVKTFQQIDDAKKTTYEEIVPLLTDKTGSVKTFIKGMNDLIDHAPPDPAGKAHGQYISELKDFVKLNITDTLKEQGYTKIQIENMFRKGTSILKNKTPDIKLPLQVFQDIKVKLSNGWDKDDFYKDMFRYGKDFIEENVNDPALARLNETYGILLDAGKITNKVLNKTSIPETAIDPGLAQRRLADQPIADPNVTAIAGIMGLLGGGIGSLGGPLGFGAGATLGGGSGYMLAQVLRSLFKDETTVKALMNKLKAPEELRQSVLNSDLVKSKGAKVTGEVLNKAFQQLGVRTPVQ